MWTALSPSAPPAEDGPSAVCPAPLGRAHVGAGEGLCCVSPGVSVVFANSTSSFILLEEQGIVWKAPAAVGEG